MIINVKGKNIEFSRVDYETAMFIIKRQYSVNYTQLQEKIAQNMFSYNSEDVDYDLEYEIDGALRTDPKIGSNLNVAFRSKLIELYRHCMKHNKYDAYLYNRSIDAFSHCNSDGAIDRLIQIEDDKELALAINFLACTGCYGLRNGTICFEREPILERMIDYFRYDYQYSEWRDIFEKMFLNIDINTIDGCVENEFSVFLNLIIYRMFLQYDKDFLYPPFSYKPGSYEVWGCLIPRDKNISFRSDKYNELLLQYKTES